MAAVPPTGARVPDTGHRRQRDALGKRLAALVELLDQRGVAFDRVSAAGVDREIAVIAAEPAEFETLSGVARQVRELGFRFVALDLSAGAETAGGAVSGPDAGAPAEPDGQ